MACNKFYRAFNHSAWLFQCRIAEYKVVRRYVKALDAYVYYVGFPMGKLQETVGKRKMETTDEGIDVTLNAGEVPDETGYATWLENVKAEAASTDDFNSLPLAGADAEREVIRRLREFPLESKTMVECAVFIAELRKLLNNK